MDAPKQMQDYWHIPRASLASSSSSAISSASSSKSSNKSNSNPPTLANRSQHQQQQQNSSSSSGKTTSATSAAVTAAAAAAVLAAAKRGSRSSQGSSDSNNSTRSAASGSLLLTAANLERFAEIHKKQERHNKMLMNSTSPTSSSSANYNANLALASNGSTPGKDAVIAIDGHDGAEADPNLHYIKTKDLDTVSIASSMHFTMVNGDNGPPKKPKRGLCDRGRQVTVLIVSMSTIFMLLIMGMVYALEMRARDMPKS
ncbi:vitellogenin-2 isoform X1 [Drosophila persimilis]|uniref:Vitellogenin-2 isoform X1 n=1 Tax=Drosophila pseudoobscura pseudoobscura TaxID=46245 RepID=A0A0R3P5X0_DROPS|nr:vitellogenin-2 isoform X1 [Drosophila pseudoobscura]XP_026849749.1 vitellogenin-2 isoform X1 [Drosophila persimilis]